MEERMTICNMVVEAGGKNGALLTHTCSQHCLWPSCPQTSVAVSRLLGLAG